MDQVRGDVEQDLPLAHVRPHQPEVEQLQVAQPTVDQAGGTRGGARGPVTPLHQHHPQSTQRQVAGDAGPNRPAADDQRVEQLSGQRSWVSVSHPLLPGLSIVSAACARCARRIWCGAVQGYPLGWARGSAGQRHGGCSSILTIAARWHPRRDGNADRQAAGWGEEAMARERTSARGKDIRSSEPPPVIVESAEAPASEPPVVRPAPALSASWQRALYLPLIILAWLVVLLIVGWVLSHFTRTILLVVFSIVIAFAVAPLANALERWLPRPLAIGLAYVIGVGVILGVGVLIILTAAAQVASLVAAAPSYAQQVQALQLQVLAQLQAAGTTIASGALGWLTEAFGVVTDLILILILSVYIAVNGTAIAEWLQRETPASQRYRAHLLVAVVNRVVGGYVRGVLTLAVLIGTLVGVGMAALGVPYAVLLGVLAFFMEFIPVLGVFISGAAALLIAMLHFHDLVHPLIVLVYFVIVHIIEGDVVGPRIMGKAVGIHPATGLIALVAGTELFGIWGALFAAPVAGMIQAVITATWVELRGGNPKQVLEAVVEEQRAQVEQKSRVP